MIFINYIKPHDFYLETNGKVIDVDGYYGGQCWDLFAYYCLKYCNKTFSCIETGYVIDLWNHFDEVGLNEFFIKVYDNYEDGDWLIYKAPSSITKSSHIAMFRCDNGNNTSTILTQNPNGNPNYTHQMICDYSGVQGALRPIIYIKKLSPNPKEKNEEKNQIYVNSSNTMYCRTSPDTSIENKTDDIFVKVGYYDVLDEIDSNGYHWYKIDKERYVAKIDGIVEYIPKISNNEFKEESILKKIIEFIIKIIKKLIY